MVFRTACQSQHQPSPLGLGRALSEAKASSQEDGPRAQVPAAPKWGNGCLGRGFSGLRGSMVSGQAISLTWGILTSWWAAWI